MAAPRPASDAYRQAAMAWEAAISVGVGFVLGYYLDQWLGTSPIFLTIFSAAGLYAGYKRIRALVDSSAASPPPDTKSGTSDDGPKQ